MGKTESLVQVRQELQPLKIGDEERFEIALRQSPVKDCPLETIKGVLRMVMLKLGIRAANLPNDEEKAVLLNHVFSLYGNHTPEEILLAFDMALASKLDIDQKDVNTYENFSCIYFSSIMNAYRKWAKDQYKEVKPKELPAPVEKITDEEFIEGQKREYLKTKNFALISDLCYKILIESDKMKKPVGPERERILKTARSWFFKENDKLNMSHEEQERMINIFAKKIAIAEFFNSIS